MSNGWGIKGSSQGFTATGRQACDLRSLEHEQSGLHFYIPRGRKLFWAFKLPLVQFDVPNRGYHPGFQVIGLLLPGGKKSSLRRDFFVPVLKWITCQ